MRSPLLALLLLATTSCDSSDYVGQVVGFGSVGGLSSLSLTPASATLTVGGSVRLIATPLDAAGQALAGVGAPTFSSANPVVAFVNDTGLVVGVSPGTVVIVASLTSGGVTRSATSTITVTSVGSQGTAGVAVGDNFFDPSSLTVLRSGAVAVVTWTWSGSRLHNVTFDDGASGSASQSAGTFARTFSAAGLYTYYCSIHGRAAMSGSIAVQ